MKFRSPPRLTALAVCASSLLSLALFVAAPPPLQAASWGHPTSSSPLALSPDNQILWVVNPSDDSVSVIRTDTNVRIAKLAAGDEPQGIALTPDGAYAFVVNAMDSTMLIYRITDPTPDTFHAEQDFVSPLKPGIFITGAEPWNVVNSPDGKRIFVANSAQDTITVFDAETRSYIGDIDLRNSVANNPDRTRSFQPRGLAVTLDNTKLYVTRFLSYTKPGGRQGDDFGREGLVAVVSINTSSLNPTDYQVIGSVPIAPQITGFKFPGVTNDTAAFPNQLQSIVIRGDQAYLPNIAASPSGPLRFNLDTHAFVNVLDGVNSASPSDASAAKFLNLHLGARTPEPGKKKLFFANVWAMAFTTQSGAGSAYVVSAASDLLVKVNVDAAGKLSFTDDADTTRYIDLNDPLNAATSGANAGKTPQGIVINDAGTRAYVANLVSRNVSVVDLTTDQVIATVQSSPLPAPGSRGETNLVGAEMFFSSRGNFDFIPGTNSLHNRLSSEGWQSCASCHFRGLTDGIIWAFAAGPRKSVPLNSTFNPHDRSQQRLLNYSAIFDEVEDFEINIRNVSGPGPLATPINGNALNPNQGLLIGDNGELDVAPTVLNAFNRKNADRPQVTVTLPGSTNKVPALTAMREWVRFAIRSPNAPLVNLGGSSSPTTSELATGRTLFFQAGCAQCHGGDNWTVSMKDFVSPPAGANLFTERNPTNFFGNPVGAQYLNQFLRNIRSFNIGVPGQGNPLGNNIGADEKAAPGVTAGVVQPAQDGLGRDYNNDGKGNGFSVPSLLGLHLLPPYLHNGAAESLSAVLEDELHRTANGSFGDLLADPAKRALVVKFVASIDEATAPFGELQWDRPTSSSPIALSRNNELLWVVNPSDDSVSVFRTDTNVRIAKLAAGDEPQGIALTPDGRFAFVVNAVDSTMLIYRITDPNPDTFHAEQDFVNPFQPGIFVTGSEPWNVVSSPDGKRIFVANSSQDSVTVFDAVTRFLIGDIDLRASVANDPDRTRQFQPRGMAVTLDNTKLYVTRFLSFTKPGGRQADDFGREGLVAVVSINTSSLNLADYQVIGSVPIASQITGFKFPGVTNDTSAFPNQLQSIVIRSDQAYLPNIAASPTGPLRFNLDTHAYVNVLDGVNGPSPVDASAAKFLNLHLGARDPEPGKKKLFFASPWAMAFTTQSGQGAAYVAAAASDLLVKVNVDTLGKLSFTVDGDTTRYIDLNDPTNSATSGANAGKNPQGIVINDAGTRAYVANLVSRNVSVVDLTTDQVIATVQSSPLPAPGSRGETNLVGAEMFFSSRGNFDFIPGTNSLHDRLSSEGWQSCASCHFRGLTDGIIWAFAAGPRKSVPLNSTFNPHNRSQQRLLNYSAVFDEVEDFEINIRNVSGPGPLAGGALNPNQGLLIGDNGSLDVAPTVLNAFNRKNADRPQVTVTLPGSANKVPALTALREWVRFAVRTPTGPLVNLGVSSSPNTDELAAGRTLFLQAGCAQCHGGNNWTVSVKDFVSPPSTNDLFTERIPTPFTDNPVGAQYLNRFLREIGSFNIGVPGQGNPLGNNVGADEKAAPGVTAGVVQPAQDGLGRDYNNDGKGIGFNVPSLLGIHLVPPFLHNGAAESLATVLEDVRHRTGNGQFGDVLTNPTNRALVVKFLESIEEFTPPFVVVDVEKSGDHLILSFDSVSGIDYGVQASDSLSGPWGPIVATVTGTGGRVEVPILITDVPYARFFRLKAP